jgi:hypothetical protein
VAQSSFLKRWDYTMTLVLIYTALVTPFEVAFTTPSVNVIFIVNRIVDIIFLGVCGAAAARARGRGVTGIRRIAGHRH